MSENLPKNTKLRMSPKLPMLLSFVIFAVCVVASPLVGGAASTSGTRQEPQTAVVNGSSSGKTSSTTDKFAKIRKIVKDYFKRFPLYQDGDLIVRSEAEKVLDVLQREGFEIQDRAAILEKTLTKESFLAKTLRSGRPGREFMHQASKYPLAYDRLDRLAVQPVGRRTVIDLVRGPDGYKMIEYMADSRYGKNLGRMLSSDKAGGDYNKPTGRIYTAKQLTDAIWQQISSPNNR